MKQQYLIIRDGIRKIEYRTQAPKGLEWYLAPADLEHADDAEIIEETDTFGEVRKRVAVDQAKREARLIAETQAKASQEEAETQERNVRKLVRQRMKDHVSAIKAASSAAETKQALIAFVEDMEKVVLRVLK